MVTQTTYCQVNDTQSCSIQKTSPEIRGGTPQDWGKKQIKWFLIVFSYIYTLVSSPVFIRDAASSNWWVHTEIHRQILSPQRVRVGGLFGSLPLELRESHRRRMEKLTELEWSKILEEHGLQHQLCGSYRGSEKLMWQLWSLNGS